MDFKKFDLKKISIPKLIGTTLLGLVLLVIVIWLIGFAFRTAFYGGTNTASRVAPVYPGVVTDGDYGGGYAESDYAIEESARLSLRKVGILPPPTPGPSQSTGNDAEEYEVTEYNATIETGNLARVCGEIEALKTFDYVIFENANTYDRGCNYVFKVENEQADAVLTIVKELDPEELYENTRTIKAIVSDYTSEIEILQNKLASVEETLTDAQRAYDQVEVLATRTQDVESLAKIIDSKIQLIERLTLERITINERIDRLLREQADQLDRLNYTFFSVNVYESHIVDLENLKDSWVAELKSFVREFNEVLQGLTVNLASFMLRLVQVVIYLIIALFIAKYGWRGARFLWKK